MMKLLFQISMIFLYVIKIKEFILAEGIQNRVAFSLFKLNLTAFMSSLNIEVILSILRFLLHYLKKNRLLQTNGAEIIENEEENEISTCRSRSRSRSKSSRYRNNLHKLKNIKFSKAGSKGNIKSSYLLKNNNLKYSFDHLITRMHSD